MSDKEAKLKSLEIENKELKRELEDAYLALGKYRGNINFLDANISGLIGLIDGFFKDRNAAINYTALKIKVLEQI